MNIETLRSAFGNASTFSTEEIVLQALLLIALSSLLSVVYLFRGNSLSNRARLAALLPLMAITTMLIISIVKSSLALSLGLVGALSIVRFRAAIKDPEELAYIFLAIALGLGFGAAQVAMTSTFYVIIVIFILVQSLSKNKLGKWFTDKDSVHLEIVFDHAQSLSKVTDVLAEHASKVKLVRLDEGKEQSMMFLVKPKSEAAVESMTAAIMKLDSKAKLTVLQYQPLV